MTFVISLVTRFGYLALFPLAAVEGPVVALGAGFMVSLGYLSFLPAYAMLILGDIISDSGYYYLGRFGNRRKLVEKYGVRLGRLSRNMGIMEKLWERHGRKTMVLSKLAYGLSTPFLVSAGLVAMPLRRFVSYALPVTLIQYAGLMAAGYALGHSYRLAADYLWYGAILFAAILVCFVAGFSIFSRYASSRIKEMEEEESP